MQAAEALVRPNRWGSAAHKSGSLLVASKPEAALATEVIGKWTFYYDPKEIVIDNTIREFLKDFRTDDGEDSFVLTLDDKGLVIY